MGSNDPDRFEIGGILACVADGTTSDHAIVAAVDLANRLDTRLELMHAVPVPDLLATRFDSSQIAAMNAERVAESRKEILAHFSHTHQDLAVSGTPISDLLHVVPGTPAKVILDRAKEADFDLLVVGDNLKDKKLDFGGVARALLGKSPCPVWMQVSPPRPIERILAPVDLSEHAFAALRAAVDVASKFGAKVSVLHCFTVHEYAYVGVPYGAGYGGLPSIDSIRTDVRTHLDEKLADFEWHGVEHETLFDEREAAAGILERQDNFDLITMGTHGRTGLAASLLGGVAYRVLRRARTPVLAIRRPDRPWLL